MQKQTNFSMCNGPAARRRALVRCKAQFSWEAPDPVVLIFIHPSLVLEASYICRSLTAAFIINTQHARVLFSSFV